MRERTWFKKAMAVLCVVSLLTGPLGTYSYAGSSEESKAYKELTFSDYINQSTNIALEDKVYGAGDIGAKLSGITSMDKVAFTGKIKFAASSEDDGIRIGGSTLGRRWNGLAVYHKDSKIVLKNFLTSGSGKEVTSIDIDDLTKNPLEEAVKIRLTFDYVNADDVRISFSVEDTEYYNGVLEDVVETLGTFFLLYVKSSSKPITLESIVDRTEYTKLTLSDMEIEDNRINGSRVVSEVPVANSGNLNATQIEGVYNFAHDNAYICIGGEDRGLKIESVEENRLALSYVEDEQKVVELGTIAPEEAGLTALTGTDIQVKTAFVFSNESGDTADVRIKIGFLGGKQLTYSITNVNKSAFLKQMTFYAADECELGYKSTVDSMKDFTPLTFTDFGFQRVTSSPSGNGLYKSIENEDLDHIAVEGYYNFYKFSGGNRNCIYFGSRWKGFRLSLTKSGNLEVMYVNDAGKSTVLGDITTGEVLDTLDGKFIKIKTGFAFTEAGENLIDVKMIVRIEDEYEEVFEQRGIPADSVTLYRGINLYTDDVNHPLVVKAMPNLKPSETLPRITLDDFTMDDGQTNGSYVGDSLNGTHFTTYVTFPDNPTDGASYIQLGGEHGIRIATTTSDEGQLVLQDMSNNSGELHYIDSSIAGTELLGNKIKLDITTEFIDADVDDADDDILLGVYLNDKLYNGQAFVLYNSAQTFGKDVCVVTDNDEYPVVITEKPDIKEVRLDAIGIVDGEYKYKNNNLSASGEYTDTLMNTIVYQKITIDAEPGSYICYAGKPSAWHGILLEVIEDGKLRIKSATNEFTNRYILEPTLAGFETFIGPELELEIEIYESGDDVKLGLYFGGNLYNNEYFTLENARGKLGSYMSYYLCNKNDKITVYGREVEVVKPELTTVTLNQLGIKKGSYLRRNDNLAAKGEYSESLMNTTFTQALTFGEVDGVWLMYGGKTAWHGVNMITRENGTIDVTVTMSNAPVYTLTPEVAGVEKLLGEEIELKVELFANVNKPEDVFVGIYINGKLYGDSYMRFPGANKLDIFGNFAGLYFEKDGGKVEVGGKGPVPTIDPNFTKLYFYSYNVKSGEYRYKQNNLAVKASCGLNSMDKVVFSDTIQFSPDLGAQFIIGGQKSAWHGLVWELTEDGKLKMTVTNKEYTKMYFDPEVAGTEFAGKDLEMTLSFEYVDYDEDGLKNDVKFAVWFNGKLYGDRWIYLKDSAEYLGGNLGIYCSDKEKKSYIKINARKQPVDIAEFGFTKDWVTELGLHLVKW